MSDTGPGHIMQLMTAGNFEGFVAALDSVEDINQRYPFNQDMTLLEHACCVDSGGQLVQELLRRGASADELNTRKKCRALHMAAESLNRVAISLLLLHKDSDPNALTWYGDNVLHVLCRQPSTDARLEACVDEVLRLCSDRALPLDVNHRNQSGRTPVYVAAERKNEPLVLMLLGHGCNIDCDDVQKGEETDEDRFTTRRLLQEWPEFQHPLPLEGEFKRDLFFLLYFGQQDEFLTRLPDEKAANSALVYTHDGKQTLLQVAVQNKLKQAVEKLLELGADPNLTQPSVLTASEDAAYRGSPEILSLLIAKNAILARENHLSAMHCLIKGMDIPLKRNYSAGSKIPEDFRDCFDVLSARKELLNARDNNECTPLHLLAMHHLQDPYFMDKLVDSGALLGVRNKSGNTPLDIMTPTELHKFLNRRIELSKPLEFPKTVTFDFRFMRYSYDNEVERYDCQSLVILSKCKERRCVLTHPVVECFIHMKWEAIRLFYLPFFVLFSMYAILLGVRVSLGKYLSPENSSVVDNTIVGSGNYKDSVLESLNFSLWFFLIIIGVLNVFYYSVLWDSLHSVMRCLLKGMIVISSVLLLSGICKENWDITITNVTILLTGTEFVLLIGDHPKLAAYVKMLKTVTWNYLKFFVWFSPLIIAFILCFSALFHDSNKGPFYNLGHWFFRGFVMLTGEFEAVELMKEVATPFLSHVVFIMFVFFLTVVLLNLLNALAVNDTVTTNEDTQLYVNISQIEILHHTEKVFAYLHKLCRNENATDLSLVRKVVRLLLVDWLLNLVDKRMHAISLKPYISSGKIIFKMNKESKWITKSTSSFTEFTLTDTDIIKRAHNIKNIENANIQELLQDLIKKMEK